MHLGAATRFTHRYNEWMAVLLSSLALLAAAGCCVLSWRAWRRSHHLALEMIQLRDRLARIERTQRDAERRARAESDVGRARAADDTRVKELEQRVDELRVQLTHAVEAHESLAEGMASSASDRQETVGVRDLVRRGLRRQGYRRVRVIEVDREGKVLVETERNGITAKGTAWVDPDGHVVLRSNSTLRAFP